MARYVQADQCWRSHRATLRSVHEFTAGATSAAGQLLHRMNAVLAAAVETNYGTGTFDAVVSLYEMITDEQRGMFGRCEELPLLLFSRSFAVVFEELVRQATVSHLTYRNPMSCEAQAELYRQGLRRTMCAANEFTACATTAAVQLLHRMNAVLIAVVDCNFGSGSYDSIGELYETIDREQLGMIERCEDLPLLLFARSYAVVMEEAVRQRVAATATVPDSPHNFNPKVFEIPQEEQKATVPPSSPPPRTVSTSSESSYTTSEDRPLEMSGEATKKTMILMQYTVPIAKLRRGETPVMNWSSEEDTATATVPRCPDNTASEASWSCSTPNEDNLIDDREMEGGEWYNSTPSITPAPSKERLDEDELRDTATVPPTGDTVSESSWSSDTPCEDQLISDSEGEEEKEEGSTGATAAAAAEIPSQEKDAAVEKEEDETAAEARLRKQFEYRAAQEAAYAVARFEFRSDVRAMNMETMVVGSDDDDDDVIDDGWKGTR